MITETRAEHIILWGGVDLSIIIPVYNAGGFLKDCLDSLLSQKLYGYEIICVDDGSVDNSMEILKEYQKKYSVIKVIHQDNSGVSTARNKGLDIAKGKYIAFVDSDDWVVQGSFGALIEKAIMLNADCVMFGYERVKETEHFTQDKKVKIELIRNDNEIALSSSNIWTIMYKRECIEANRIRFCEEMKYGEDTLFSGIVSFFIRPEYQYICKSKIYQYRQNSNSVTHLCNFVQHEKDMLCMIREYKKLLQSETGLSQQQKKNLRDRCYLLSAAALFDSLRTSEIDSVSVKYELEKQNLYPYPFMPYILKRKFNLPNLIMFILKIPIVFWFLNKTKVLEKI